MAESQIVVSRQGVTAVVTLNRPAVRNALNLPMWDELKNALRALSADGDLRCMVLRGAGGNFSAGADIKSFATERGTRAQADHYAQVLHESMQSIRVCQHPVVAQLEGVCLGGGAGIASMCDFRVGGEGIRFGITARNLGIWYPYAEIDSLIQIAGTGVAAEILIEGRIFTGREAYEKGLLSRVVPDEQVEAEAMALAERIGTGSALSARFHKAALRKLRGTLPISAEEELAGNAFVETEDFRNAARAFMEKRKPTFAGR